MARCRLTPAMALERVQRNWDRFGQLDPLWAVVSRGDKRGGAWDEDEFFETGRREVADVLALAEPSAMGSCLDFGCGVGRLTLSFADHFDQVVGVDIAPSMIAKANEFADQVGNVRYELNAAPDLALFPDESFDFVNASIVLQHMPSQFALGYLHEFARVLTPGGRLVFNLPSEPTRTLRGWLYRVAPKRLIYALKTRRDGAAMEMNPVPIAQLIGRLEAAGLTVERVRSFYVGDNWLAFRYVCMK